MFGLIAPVYAQCPVCVVTVGGGLLIAKKLGIDDLLVSIWLSGLNTAIAFWFANALKTKTKLLKNGFAWSLVFYLLTMGYLVISKQVGHRGNTFIGMDKVVFGITFGYILSLAAILIERFMRNRNNGKALFPYQKVVVPLVVLVVSTVFFAFFIKIYPR